MKETWGKEGLDWLKRTLKDENTSDGKVVFPRYWKDPRFGISRRTAPVIGISWYEANAYCKWLTAHCRELPEFNSLSTFHSPEFAFRLPTEPEWILAAGGMGEPIVIGKNKEGKDIFRYRFPWDEVGKVTPEPVSDDDEIMKEIIRRANVEQSISRTTPAGMYPLGRTANGLWDMSGNVWEWQANYYRKEHDWLSLRGGSWPTSQDGARVSFRNGNLPGNGYFNYGFRVVLAPPSKPL